MRQRWSGRGHSSGSGSNSSGAGQPSPAGGTRGQSSRGQSSRVRSSRVRSSPGGGSRGQSSASGSRGQSSGTGRSRMSYSQLRTIISTAGVPVGFQASTPRIQAIVDEARGVPHGLTQDALDNSTFLEHYADLPPIDPHWDDGFDSDETEPPSDEPQPSSSRRVRGRSMLTALDRLGAGETLHIHFNEQGAPCGRNGQTWIRHIGLLVRDTNVVPHNLLRWTDLSGPQRDHLWRASTVSYTLV